MNQETRLHAGDARQRIGVAGCRLLLDIALEHGLHAEDVLRGTGIEQAQLDNPDADVESGQQLAMMLQLVMHLGDRSRGLGLIYGSRLRSTFFGIWGYALMSSPTARDAVELARHFLDLSYSPARIDIHCGETESWIRVDARHLPPMLQPLATEVVAAAAMSLAREILDTALPIPLLRLQFAHEPQTDPERYREIFGIVPEFGQQHNETRFDSRLLNLQLPRGDTLNWRMCQTQCHQLLQKRRLREGWSGRVREQLVREPAAMPPLEQLAAGFEMQPQKLRRLLAAEDTSYRALVDEVKRLLAEEMLARGDMYVQDVALRLGYESAISFTQSFKRWTRVTPSDYLRGKRADN